MINFILGVLAMSLFAVVIDAFVNNDDAKEFFMGGPIMWIWAAFMLGIVKPLYHFFKFHGRRSLLYNKDEQKYYYCKTSDFPLFFGYNSSWEWAKGKNFSQYVDLWGKKFVYREQGYSTPSMRYAPKAIWKQYEPISKEVITKIKEDAKNSDTLKIYNDD